MRHQVLTQTQLMRRLGTQMTSTSQRKEIETTHGHEEGKIKNRNPKTGKRGEHEYFRGGT